MQVVRHFSASGMLSNETIILFGGASPSLGAVLSRCVESPVKLRASLRPYVVGATLARVGATLAMVFVPH